MVTHDRAHGLLDLLQRGRGLHLRAVRPRRQHDRPGRRHQRSRRRPSLPVRHFLDKFGHFEPGDVDPPQRSLHRCNAPGRPARFPGRCSTTRRWWDSPSTGAIGPTSAAWRPAAGRARRATSCRRRCASRHQALPGGVLNQRNPRPDRAQRALRPAMVGRRPGADRLQHHGRAAGSRARSARTAWTWC